MQIKSCYSQWTLCQYKYNDDCLKYCKRGSALASKADYSPLPVACSCTSFSFLYLISHFSALDVLKYFSVIPQIFTFHGPVFLLVIPASLALTSGMPFCNQILLHTAYPSYQQLCFYERKKKIGVGSRFTFERGIYVHLLNCMLCMHQLFKNR